MPNVDPAAVKLWLQEEGVYSQDERNDAAKIQWAIRVPIDIQQSINMSVAIPLGKEDSIAIALNILPDPESQKIFRGFEDQTKVDFVRALTLEFIRSRDVVPVFGQQPDGSLAVGFAKRIGQDAPLTKHALMNGIGDLARTYLFYELAARDLFKRFKSTAEFSAR